ncbi:hypothetical protein HS088_TW09G01387 [Tripterygium wilfordii]|uniref:Uncharacterized protein n=1 Tax=Tripterygium wilfordii TaxID=458696 RepID=A0A7J7DAD8_TRIWF|nr:hypothetical protein HS088_TW09G01387 [Tripterygium wilfordii]
MASRTQVDDLLLKKLSLPPVSSSKSNPSLSVSHALSSVEAFSPSSSSSTAIAEPEESRVILRQRSRSKAKRPGPVEFERSHSLILCTKVGSLYQEEMAEKLHRLLSRLLLGRVLENF